MTKQQLPRGWTQKQIRELADYHDRQVKAMATRTLGTANMSRMISPLLVRYIKLGRHGGWEDECLEKGIIRLGFGLETSKRFQVCKKRDWDRLTKIFVNAGDAPKEASRFTNEIRHFFDDDGTTLWITFRADRMYWGFVDPKAPRVHSDGVGIWRHIAKGWQCTDLRGRELTKNQLPYAVTRLAGYPGTSCEVKASDFIVRRINGRATKNAHRVKAILTGKPVRGRSLPLKDEADVMALQQARSRLSRRIHNRLTNQLRARCLNYRLLEGDDPTVLFDALIEKHNRSDDLLVEVKSSNESAHIRMAVGQLYSYWHRLFGGKKPHLAILTPDKPGDLDVSLLDWLGIGILWFDHDRLRTSTASLNHLTGQ